MTATVTKPRRRRRSPDEAVGEIIAAAEQFLRERPFREMTVDEVMRRTELSRPSFYVYFRDRHHLVLQVVEHITAELFTPSERWYESSDDGEQMAREALEEVVDLFHLHGPVLRALSDAAPDAPDVERAYSQMVQTFVDHTARHIADEIAAGRIAPIDAYETAKALILMNERYLNDSLGREPRTPRDVVTSTLVTIWTRTLYPRGS
ncbi:MAG: TetR/AcrR family transcriptional regulator [Actinomycetota bacterium]|nr:TetR/AcrR family transcriptional regulator [Actinomycetota bacterium]